MLEIISIPALKDNYIWFIIHRNSQQCMVIDPGEAEPVIKELKKRQLTLAGILITHHHWDHTQGIAGLLDYQNVPVYGPKHEAIPFITQLLQEGDKLLHPPMGLDFTILDIPGHTRGHIAYYGHGALFSGDTLFTAGCGRVFEGTAQQMYDSLQKMAGLPDSTQLYCGHEYTEQNLAFALKLEPQNPDILQRADLTRRLRSQGLPSVPAPLEVEKRTNPFLRTSTPAIITAAQQHTRRPLETPIEVFSAIREWKNTSQ